MKRAKRVRFKVPEGDRSQSGGLNAASAPAHDPKTSEFAFFKKFREDASLKNLSKSLPRGNIQLEGSEGKNDGGDECYILSTSHGREVKGNTKISDSSLFEDARPSKTDLLLSPQFVCFKRSGMSSSSCIALVVILSSIISIASVIGALYIDKTGLVEQGDKNPLSSSLKTNRSNDQVHLDLSCLLKTPTTAGPDDFCLERATESVRTDTRHMDGDIFSKKRAKLQSMVAKTMFPGNHGIRKGCDVISLLLNRLLPDGYGNSHCEDIKSRCGKRAIEDKSVYLPKSDNQLKESWTRRKLVKYEEPWFMDAGISSSWSNKFHRSILLEGSVEDACLLTLECADKMVFGHHDRKMMPYISPVESDYNQSWNKNSAEAFGEEKAKVNSSFRRYGHNTMTLEHEPIQGKLLTDGPSSSCHYGLDNTLSAQKRFLVNGESSTAAVNNCNSKFLLEYEKREPEWITNSTEAPNSDFLLDSTFGGSLGKCRRSPVTIFMELDQSSDDPGHSRFRRKKSNLLGGWDPECEKREREWIANNTEAPCSDSWLDSSHGECKQSAFTTLMELDQSYDDLVFLENPNDGLEHLNQSYHGLEHPDWPNEHLGISDQSNEDLGHSSFRRKPSNLLVGWENVEYEKREPEWITNNTKAPSSDSWLDVSLGNCRQSKMSNLMELDQSNETNDGLGHLDQSDDGFGHLWQTNDDIGHFGLGKKQSNLLLGWDTDRLDENGNRYSFPSTALMHYQQRSPETTTVPDCYYSSSFLPLSLLYTPSYTDNTPQRFDTGNNNVITRSHPPFWTPGKVIASENGFALSPSRHSSIKEIVPQRSYPPMKTIMSSASASVAYPPLPDFHTLQAPVKAYSSSYLLLEGGMDTHGQSSGVREMLMSSDGLHSFRN